MRILKLGGNGAAAISHLVMLVHFPSSTALGIHIGWPASLSALGQKYLQQELFMYEVATVPNAK